MSRSRRRTAVTAPRRWARLCVLLLCAVLVSCTVPASAGERSLEPDIVEERGGPAVLVGVPGLLWEDVSRESTPFLWELTGEAGIGNMSIRSATSRTCPTDGWLSVSAGQRALSEREHFTVCEPAPRPESDGSGATVPDFEDHIVANRNSEFSAPVGLLGQTVSDSGGTTLAVGPGAALGAADTSGYVDHYIDGVGDLTSERLREVSLAVVELPELTRLYPDPPVTGEEDSGSDEKSDPDDVPEWVREEALAALDDRLRSLTEILPTGSSLSVAGVSMDTGPSRLTVALSGDITDAGFEGPSAYLASDSTRRAGLVTLTDTTPTLLSQLGMRLTEPTNGRVWHTTERPEGTEESVKGLVDFNTAAVVVGTAIPGFFSGLVVFQLLIYAAAAFALHRHSAGQRGKRKLVLSVTRVVALAGAAFPVASYLANLIPWWAASTPMLALLGCVLLADAAVVALAVLGPWRNNVLGPMTIVAGSTALVLFLDLCFGANLQMNSPTGYSPIVAGRFYGIGNIAFAAFATGMLMAVAGLAHWLISQGLHRTAVWTTLAVGSVSVLVIGWPGLGTDFGGVLGLIPGLAVTTMMIAGVRITVPRFAVVGVTAVTVISALSWMDHLRPPNERSHFGAFAAQVANGEAVTVLTRKLTSMLGTLGNWQLTLLAGGALLFLFLVLKRPTRWRIGALQRAYEHAPTLRAGLTGSLVTALVGFAANDSGIAIPAIALTVMVPLTLSVCVWALQQDDDEGPKITPNDDKSLKSAQKL